MGRWLRRGFAILWWAVTLCAVNAEAAGPLTLELKPQALRPRDGGSQALDVTLTYSGPGLLEGALEFRPAIEDAEGCRFRTQDLSLVSGRKQLRLTLPPGVSSSGPVNREVAVRFVAKDRELDLGRFDVGSDSVTSRTFTIAVCRAAQPMRESGFALWQALRVERTLRGEKFAGSLASTWPVHVDPADLPVVPLHFASFDIVLIEAAELAMLKEKQLAALSRWVLAGGSLCVIANGKFDAVRREFIAGLLQQSAGVPPIEYEEDKVVPAPAHAPRLIRAGFGRLVIATRVPDSEAAAEVEGWTEVTAFLSKIMPVSAEARERAAQRPFSRPGSRRLQFYIIEAIKPSSVRIIPPTMLASLLLAFVVVIGPGDWLVLGRFRLRRWTWVLFPAMSVGFTAAVVLLAEHYSGKDAPRTSVSITDFGVDGRSLREARFELIFPVRTSTAVTEVRQSLFAQFSMLDGRRVNFRGAPRKISGVYPAQYRVEQPLSQWAPQINRVFTLDPAPDDSGLDWQKLDPRSPDSSDEVRRSSADPTTDLFLLKDGKISPLRPVRNYAGLIVDLCLAEPVDWKSLSRRAPSDFTMMEDLTIAQMDEPEVLAVIATRRVGDDLRIFRRLYVP